MAHDDIFFAVHLYFCTGVLAGEHFIANLQVHGNFVAVYNAAWANGYNFSHLGFFFGSAGKNNTAFCGLDRKSVV